MGGEPVIARILHTLCMQVEGIDHMGNRLDTGIGAALRNMEHQSAEFW